MSTATQEKPFTEWLADSDKAIVEALELFKNSSTDENKEILKSVLNDYITKCSRLINESKISADSLGILNEKSIYDDKYPFLAAIRKELVATLIVKGDGNTKGEALKAKTIGILATIGEWAKKAWKAIVFTVKKALSIAWRAVSALMDITVAGIVISAGVIRSTIGSLWECHMYVQNKLDIAARLLTGRKGGYKFDSTMQYSINPY